MFSIREVVAPMPLSRRKDGSLMYPQGLPVMVVRGAIPGVTILTKGSEDA